MLELTVTGAVILTSRLTTYQRTTEETALMLNRKNFSHRAFCVAAALAAADSYQEAAVTLLDGGWFTELGATALAAAMESEADDLMNYATSLGLPIEGLVAIKAEPGGELKANKVSTGENPVEPKPDGDDIPI